VSCSEAEHARNLLNHVLATTPLTVRRRRALEQELARLDGANPPLDPGHGTAKFHAFGDIRHQIKNDETLWYLHDKAERAERRRQTATNGGRGKRERVKSSEEDRTPKDRKKRKRSKQPAAPPIVQPEVRITCYRCGEVIIADALPDGDGKLIPGLV